VILVGCTQEQEFHIEFFFLNLVERCIRRYGWYDNIKVEAR
jgi:hypothetical protein